MSDYRCEKCKAVDSGAALTAANTQLAHKQTYIKHLEKQWGMLQAKLTAEREVSDKLERAIKQEIAYVVQNDGLPSPWLNKALSEVAHIRSQRPQPSTSSPEVNEV